MALLTSPTQHAMPFSDFPKFGQQPTAVNDMSASPRYPASSPRSQQLRPSPRSLNSYYATQRVEPSTWPPNEAYHPIITNFAYPSGADHAQHSLRRKTPNGTIDNGYDGTPTQLACGPPAPKYLNMTLTGDVFPDSGRSIQSPSAMSWYYSQAPRDSCDGNGVALTPVVGGFNQDPMLYSPAYSPVYSPALPSPSLNAQSMNSGFAMRNNYANNYAGYNSANPGWVDGPLAGYQHGMQMSTGYPPHNIPYEGGFVTAQAPLPPWPSNMYGHSQNPPFRMLHLNDGFSRNLSAMHPPSQQLQNLPLGSGLPGAGNGVPQTWGATKSYSERVLADAHRAYTDLVTQISRTKKISHGRTNSRSLKNLIFPKAPKHLVNRPSSYLQRAHHTFPGTMSAYPHRHVQPPLNGHLLDKMAGDSGMLPSARLDVTGHALGGYPVVPGAVYGNVVTPIDQREVARHWFMMLEKSCEVKGWRWLDGMLMGGCLLHSLERYEEALIWFNRIIGLDSK